MSHTFVGIYFVNKGTNIMSFEMVCAKKFHCSPAKAPMIAVEFNNNNVDNTDYFTTSTFNNVVRSQVGNFFIVHENMRSVRKFLTNFIHLHLN